MTPGARVAAAIEILDQVRGGIPAERALTAWARGSRYAGSKDRAAIRDHVFDVLRAKRSLGDGDGRALMIALALRDGWDVDALFCGQGHAPAALMGAERSPVSVTDAAAVCDLPDWLWPLWQDSLGDQAEAAAHAQQVRASVFLRVNMRRGDRESAIRMLADDGILAVPHGSVQTALRVIENPRRIKTSRAYLNGYVELQDASSQHAVAQPQVPADARVLDYCAGGGGKALALADMYDCQVVAHDIAPDRMKDLPVRADRAGVRIETRTTAALASAAPFDVVFCDAPCSGSGTWRRVPDAKWRLSEDNLAKYQDMQSEVILSAADLTGPDGVLAYATCSVLRQENDVIIDKFLKARPEWRILYREQLVPCDDWDGFFLCCLTRDNSNL